MFSRSFVIQLSRAAQLYVEIGGKDAGFRKLHVSFKHLECHLLGILLSVFPHVGMQEQMLFSTGSLSSR